MTYHLTSFVYPICADLLWGQDQRWISEQVCDQSWALTQRKALASGPCLSVGRIRTHYFYGYRDLPRKYSSKLLACMRGGGWIKDCDQAKDLRRRSCVRIAAPCDTDLLAQSRIGPHSKIPKVRPFNAKVSRVPHCHSRIGTVSI